MPLSFLPPSSGMPVSRAGRASGAGRHSETAAAIDTRRASSAPLRSL